MTNKIVSFNKDAFIRQFERNIKCANYLHGSGKERWIEQMKCQISGK